MNNVSFKGVKTKKYEMLRECENSRTRCKLFLKLRFGTYMNEIITVSSKNYSKYSEISLD